MNQAGQQAIQKVLNAIEHEFALASVTVHKDTWVHYTNVSGIKILAGTYEITDRPEYDPRTLWMQTCSPAIAHHLRTTGQADVAYKNGRIDKARNLKAEAHLARSQSLSAHMSGFMWGDHA